MIRIRGKIMISHRIRTIQACAGGLLLALAVLLPLRAEAGCDKEWKTWHDKGRGEHGILKIKYQVCSGKEQNFKVYRNKDWDGNKNTFEKLEEFTISPKSKKHEKTYPRFYEPITGAIEVSYSVEADYKKGRVYSKGHVKYPNHNVFPVVTETKKWNQFFYEIPEEGNIIFTPSNEQRDFVETSDIWAARCSDLACGQWVRFNDYTEAHRYNANIPGIGPVIIQLWKGWCPRFNEMPETSALREVLNMGKEFPGGLGAEVGVYVPPDGSNRMVDAAFADTPVGRTKWVPLVNPDLRIAFKLVNTKTGKVIVDAPEKNTWWRTKWMSPDKYKEYKKTEDVPENPLEYTLQYWINGVRQPDWIWPGDRQTGEGRYPELGFNGIWAKDDGALVIGNWKDFNTIELYDSGKSVQVTLWSQNFSDAVTPLDIPLDGTLVKGADKVRGPYTVSATRPGPNDQGEPRLTLDYKYEKASAFDRTYELILKPNGDIHILNTPVIFFPL